MKKAEHSENTRPRYPWIIGVVLTIFGIAVSFYLAYLHYAVHNDFTYASFCTYSKAVNCETVAESIFSVFAGVPVAVWGLLGYALVGAVCVMGLLPSAQGRRMWMALYVLSVVFCLVSILLFILSKLYIKSLCIMCLVSYGVNFGLLALAMHFRSHWKIPLWQGFKDDMSFLWARKKATISTGAVFIIAAVVLSVSYPRYWLVQHLPDPSKFSSGYTEDGHPWIGAEDPVVTIIEYSDYLCFHCRKANAFLRNLVERFPDKVRLVHYHYPQEKQCNPAVKEDGYHKGSCIMAVWANCAGKQGAFWKAHDALFQLSMIHGTISVEELAEKVGLDKDRMLQCVKDETVYREVSKDVLEGVKLEIEGTPFFVVDGETYTGQLPLKLLEERLGSIK